MPSDGEYPNPSKEVCPGVLDSSSAHKPSASDQRCRRSEAAVLFFGRNSSKLRSEWSANRQASQMYRTGGLSCRSILDRVGGERVGGAKISARAMVTTALA